MTTNNVAFNPYSNLNTTPVQTTLSLSTLLQVSIKLFQPLTETMYQGYLFHWSPSLLKEQIMLVSTLTQTLEPSVSMLPPLSSAPCHMGSRDVNYLTWIPAILSTTPYPRSMPPTAVETQLLIRNWPGL